MTGPGYSPTPVPVESASGTTSRPIVNAFTVDVEDYFQVSAFDAIVPRDQWDSYPSRVEGNTARLLELLASHDVRGTFFVLGWIAERFPRLVRRIAEAGHELASHGYGHRLVYEQSPDEFRNDVRLAKLVLEQATGRAVEGYRAPSFSITRRSLWALDVLIEEGFTWDASIFPIRHDRYGIPSAPRHPFWVDLGIGPADAVQASRPAQPLRGSPAFVSGGPGGLSDRQGLLEIPASTVRLGGVNLPIAGGGYFRLLPYRWTAWGIGHVNRTERRPVMFYVHPWELDPAQPRFAADRLSRFRHYRNLGDTEHRLRRLLTDFRFQTVAETLAECCLSTHSHVSAAQQAAGQRKGK